MIHWPPGIQPTPKTAEAATPPPPVSPASLPVTAHPIVKRFQDAASSSPPPNTVHNEGTGGPTLAKVDTEGQSEAVATGAQSEVSEQEKDSAEKPATVRAVVRRFTNISPRKVEWLWKDRIASGKVTLLAGDPETGKTLVCIDIAGHVSTGSAFPDGSECRKGSVLILSAEDDAEDTLRPRLDAAGADVSRVYIVDAVRRVHESGKSIKLPFNLATDLAALAVLVKDIGDVRLIIIDPISAYLGSSDSHVNSEVRALLAPLAEFAAKHRVAVVAITHLSKGQGAAIYRAIGSIAFVAAARAAWMFAKDPHDPERRLMLRLKNNLAGDIGGLAYRIEPAGSTVRVAWEFGPVELQADEIINLDPFEKPSQRQEAADFIRATLAGGPRQAKEVIAEAKAAGISLGTLKRARAQVGVVADKAGFSDPWYWSLPANETGEGAQPKQQTPEEPQDTRSEPLREDNHKESKLNQQFNRRSSPDNDVSLFAGEKDPQNAHEEAHNAKPEPLRASDCKERKLQYQVARRSSPTQEVDSFGGDEPLRGEETGSCLPPEALQGNVLTPELVGRKLPEREKVLDLHQDQDGAWEV